MSKLSVFPENNHAFFSKTSIIKVSVDYFKTCKNIWERQILRLVPRRSEVLRIRMICYDNRFQIFPSQPAKILTTKS